MRNQPPQQQALLSLLSDEQGENAVFPNEGVSLLDLLKVAKLDRHDTNAEVWQISESSQKLAYFTHGLMRFYGKFPPPVARLLIERYCPSDGFILDPMVGSGTSLVEALLLGRSALGMDINPLACLLSRVKIFPVNPEEVERTLARLSVRFDGILRSIERDLLPLVPRIPRMDHWFFDETVLELAALRKFILREISDERVRDVFWVALAAIIRRVSRASTGMGRIFFDPYYQHQPVLPIFTEKIVSMLPSLRELHAFVQTRARNPSIRVAQGDAKQVALGDHVADLIICHPPYFNGYKYSSVYRFEMYWLGFDLGSTQKSEVREAFKVGKPEKVSEYVDDMAAILREQHRVLRPRGVCGLMIGDTNMKGERICTTAMVLERAEQIGFTVEKLFVRKPLLTEASYKTALRRTTKDLGANMSDFVVVMRKVR